jgi:hypothetical protein
MKFRNNSLTLTSALLFVFSITSATAQSGCTIPGAWNYNAAAIEDDGSCTQLICDYTGPRTITFTKNPFQNPLPQDVIGPGLTLRRGTVRGIFNSAAEGAYNVGAEGPADTQWHFGGVNQALPFVSWKDAIAIQGAPGNLFSILSTDPITTMRMISTGWVFEIQWHTWGKQSQGAGCSYTRTFMVEESGCQEIPFGYGCTNPLAYNFDAEAIIDDGSCTELNCDYVGYEQVTITKNPFQNPIPEDVISENMILKRESIYGIYNGAQEAGYNIPAGGPADTEWHWGDVNANYAFTDWKSAILQGELGNLYVSLLSDPVTTMRILSTGWVFEIHWQSWGTQPQGAGYSYTRTFIPEASGCIEVPFGSGCTDPEACNYEADALVNDGSCIYPGCTDPEAVNFDPEAGCDDASCQFPPADCPADINEDGVVNTNDLLNLLAAFGETCNPLLPTCAEDIDNNGQMDTNDLLAFLSAFGSTC